MVVPVPLHDPRARGRRSSRRGAGPHGIRPLRQAQSTVRSTPTRVTSNGCANCSSTAWTCDDVTLFGQDWGSLIGLRLVGEHPERFARVAIGNGGLPTGDERMGEAFKAWQDFSQTTPELHVGNIVSGGCHGGSAPTSSPPTTRRSPTSPTRRVRDSSRRWCRRHPTTRPTTPTSRRGRCSRVDQAVPLSASQQRRDHRRWRAKFIAAVPGRTLRRTRRSTAAATSCKRKRSRAGHGTERLHRRRTRSSSRRALRSTAPRAVRRGDAPTKDRLDVEHRRAVDAVESAHGE